MNVHGGEGGGGSSWVLEETTLSSMIMTIRVNIPYNTQLINFIMFILQSID